MEKWSVQINFVYDSSVLDAPAGFKTGLAAAASIIDAMILNPVTITLQVGFGEDNGLALAAGMLAEAQPAYGLLQTYDQVATELRHAVTSADQATFASYLPQSDPANGAKYFVSVAQAIAWGVVPGPAGQIDGYAGFSSTFPFDYDPSDGITSGTYDFVGVALHELTHALGRYLDPRYLTPLNLMGYGGAGTLNTDAAYPRHLSIDGGKTSLATFDTASDAADLASNGSVDPFFAVLPIGTAVPWTSLDSEVMNVLGYRTANALPAPVPVFATLDTTSNVAATQYGTAYSGPVAGIEFQFLASTIDSMNVTSGISNVFIHSGAGNDALNVANVAGRNVLDGGYGSNFLVGSLNSGSRDTFFVDARNATGDIWSTIANAHAGDDATMWGVTRADFALTWIDGQGAAGYQGLTLRATATGTPNAFLTIAGYTVADLSNGRLAVSFGTVDTNSYMNIKVVG